MKALLLPLACLCALLRTAAAEEKPAAIDWQPWTDTIFEKAKAEHKFVLLDLGAVWCHWCHVMDENTYSDPEVIRLLRGHYIAVRVDQDARPDLSNRYEDYGWPATIIFKMDGSELAKRSGYLPPKPMASLLQAIIDDPTPGPSVQHEPVLAAAKGPALTKAQAAAARDAFITAYDTARGGWGSVHHFLDWNALEYCLTEGMAGDAAMTQRARQTLTAGLKLTDPAWGGVYQYSTDGDWDHPHFEKIMPFQAENMRVFALAARLWQEPKWLEPAQKIRGYLKTFLSSPEGAFYTSQDADAVQGEHGGEYFALDDAARRKRGVPRVDQHIYARDNGLAITGLAALYAASGDEGCLAEARSAAEWVVAHRALKGGGFRHDETDAAGPYLADTLAMGRAFLALYTVTAERGWLGRAREATRFIEKTFHAPVGFATAAATPPFAPKPQVDENLALVRLCTLLGHASGDKTLAAMAGHGMGFLAAPTVVEGMGYATGGVLLADREMREEPAHITVVGFKGDAGAKALFAAVLKGAPAFSRLEWYDRGEGPLPGADVEYPVLPAAAAFVCAGGACSAPLKSVADLERRLAKLRKASAASAGSQ